MAWKRTILVSALLLGAVAYAGPANNSLVVGTSQEPPNIYDPWNTNNLAIASEINGFMGASLIAPDDDGDLYAEIATTVPTLANGGYKIVKNAAGDVVRNSMTYSIRKDAKWSDGKPITIADFQFWLKVQNDDRVPVPSRTPWDRAKITPVDADTFTVTFEPPYLFADQTGPSAAPSHVMSAAWNAFDNATKNQKDAKVVSEEWKKFISSFTTARNLPKVVAGPFRPTAWRPGNSLTMVRNPNYWRTPKGGDDKYVQTVTYRFIPNTNTLKVNVLSGQLDAISAVSLTFDQALDLQRSERNKFKTYFVPGAIWEHIDVNARSPKAKDLDLDDPRMRQALLMSIDRDALVKALFQGKQAVSNSWVNPISKLYKKNVRDYNLNVTQAKALFADLGWKPGSDGILTKNGKKLSLSFSTTAGNTTRERVQQILQDQWKKVGVQVNIQNYPSSVFFGPDMLSKGQEGKWDLAMYAWTGNPVFEEGNLFKGEGVPTAANGYAGQNYAGWNNADFNKLQKQAQSEFDLAERIKLFDRMQTIWSSEVPSLPLYYRVNPYTKVNGLLNYTFSAYTLYPSWNAYQIGWASRGAAEVNKQK
ncbi:peptide ABC transporter substrate-binding protein [Deinococcus maricopensis]|uniref:ABC-type transporter, periplasmic subunit n=1 Tax=Deinococcus maricopensis (strain DSM 21211 / LMG 22137 / NRRL B-23946 / LB-34) TaxID=709986 RepID=E8U2Y9_DEIML|nr:peptide ABC transporter substrate-binding protein [Deinococcus maricopensis]ADV65727.1 ABC-type transporter, periplasmic subunit [Deinococcus maricopensis DSM 21211]